MLSVFVLAIAKIGIAFGITRENDYFCKEKGE
jgi:hypothetical protein